MQIDLSLVSRSNGSQYYIIAPCRPNLGKILLDTIRVVSCGQEIRANIQVFAKYAFLCRNLRPARLRNSKIELVADFADEQILREAEKLEMTARRNSFFELEF